MKHILLLSELTGLSCECTSL